ncbi:uncharacterized protein LOC125533473 isoform X2 [Triticum urartu]|uniref:uncharacterized protein LOC125533473 isoform X2 n=1 Tax=Triticum urartu TaxID=4572 RepID=UPI002044044D|nr:uncharacterized protein LOC125533473 isoform X2 [Triticum urartu]
MVTPARSGRRRRGRPPGIRAAVIARVRRVGMRLPPADSSSGVAAAGLRDQLAEVDSGRILHPAGRSVPAGLPVSVLTWSSFVMESLMLAVGRFRWGSESLTVLLVRPLLLVLLPRLTASCLLVGPLLCELLDTLDQHQLSTPQWTKLIIPREHPPWQSKLGRRVNIQH